MNEQLIRLAQRTVAHMLNKAQNKDALTLKTDLNQFMGMGLILAFIYEEATGNNAEHMKPQQVIEWAINQPMTRPRGVLN